MKQSAGITADVLARIEATAHRPRKRGRGIESAASAAARGTGGSSRLENKNFL